MTTFAGGGVAGGTLTGYSDGLGTGALFKLPTAMVIDAVGQLFVCDYTTIRKVSTKGTQIYDVC